MASNIISETIDDQYPVAGIDNDSQGFRDNFNVIKTSLSSAKTEMDDQQTKSLLNAPLENQSQEDFETNNTLDYNPLIAANLRGSTLEADLAVVGDTNRALSFATAHYYKLNDIETSLTLTLDNWPATNYAEMLIHLEGNGGNDYVITFAGENQSAAPSNLFTDESTEWTGATITLLQADGSNAASIVKAWTPDGGNNVYLNFVGKFEAA
jgi:hypothetical protein